MAILEVNNLGVRFTRKDAPPIDAVRDRKSVV